VWHLHRPVERRHFIGGTMHTLAWVGIALLVCWTILTLGLGVPSGIVHVFAVVGLILLVWGLMKRSSVLGSRI
jgi:hypothetical protein